jgi:hypothetical protein
MAIVTFSKELNREPITAKVKRRVDSYWVSWMIWRKNRHLFPNIRSMAMTSKNTSGQVSLPAI